MRAKFGELYHELQNEQESKKLYLATGCDMPMRAIVWIAERRSIWSKQPSDIARFRQRGGIYTRDRVRVAGVIWMCEKVLGGILPNFLSFTPAMAAILASVSMNFFPNEYRHNNRFLIVVIPSIHPYLFRIADLFLISYNSRSVFALGACPLGEERPDATKKTLLPHDLSLSSPIVFRVALSLNRSKTTNTA